MGTKHVQTTVAAERPNLNGDLQFPTFSTSCRFLFSLSNRSMCRVVFVSNHMGNLDCSCQGFLELLQGHVQLGTCKLGCSLRALINELRISAYYPERPFYLLPSVSFGFNWYCQSRTKVPSSNRGAVLSDLWQEPKCCLTKGGSGELRNMAKRALTCRVRNLSTHRTLVVGCPQT